MKKMYNNPKTEAVEMIAGNLLDGGASIGNKDSNPRAGTVVDAPARTSNPLNGQISM